MRYPLPLLVAFMLCFSSLTPAQEETASDAGSAETNIRELIENEKKTEEVSRAKAQKIQARGALPRTPLELLLLISEANRSKDYDRAASFLDLRYLPEEASAWNPIDLGKALTVVWAQQNIVDITRVSDLPSGHLDDGLPEYRDLLGTIVKDDGSNVPVYLQRIPDGDGGKTWKISNATVAEIPDLWDDLGYGPIAVWAQKYLPDYRFAGMYSWQLIASVVFVFAAWPAAGILGYLLMRLALVVPNRFPAGISAFFRGPFKVFLFLLILRQLMDQLALSLAARVYLNSSGVDYIAFSILLLGLISLIRDYNIRRLEEAGNRHYVALLKPFTTIVKLLALVVIALIWADKAGYNMSTIIAGLGVGSLAVALAAQKTLENVIGAITLYTARPVNPGDLCRFGTVVGVVEEIGLRSTLIRTLDRSMLVVPNSVFSSVEVENFSHRDRMRYYRHIELQMTTANQLRLILAKLRELLLSHAEILQETVSVRLEKVAAATAVIRIDASVPTTDFQRYLAVAEDLNLRTIELVHEAGAVFSGPGQVLQVRDFQQAPEEKMREIEAQLQTQISDGTFPFPDFSAEQKSDLRGRIELSSVTGHGTDTSIARSPKED